MQIVSRYKYLILLFQIVISQNIFKNFIDNDNKSIEAKIKSLLSIYRKKLRNIKQKYFTKYRSQIIKLRYNNNSSSESNSKYKVFDRLYNYQRIRLNKIDNLKQKDLLVESNKYSYYPKINNYSLIINKYNSFNNDFSIISYNDRIPDISTDYSRKNKGINFVKTNEEEKNNDFIELKPKNNMIFNYKNKIPIPNNNKQSNIKYQNFYKNVRFKFDKITKIKKKKIGNKMMNKTLSLNKIFPISIKDNDNSKNNINNFSSTLNDKNSRKINSYCNHYLSKSIFEDFSPEKDNMKQKNENSLYLQGIKNYNNINKSNLVIQTFKNKFNYIMNKNNNRNIDSLNTKQNSLSTKISISQNEPVEQYSTIKHKKTITLNYSLFPSKTNSISLTLDNMNKEEETNDKNKVKKILIKKIINNKLSNDELKKLKIFKKFKTGKKLTSIPLSNKSFNKELNKNNNILKVRKKKKKINPGIINVINNSLNNLNKNKESCTTLQTMTDEKMMEMANCYIKEEDNVDKSLIDDILSSKRNK